MSAQVHFDNEDHVFGMPDYMLWVALLGLLGWPALGVLIGVSRFYGHGVQRPGWVNALALVIGCGLVAFLFFSCLYYVVAYPKYRILINRDRVAEIGLIKTKTIPMAAVTEAYINRGPRSMRFIRLRAHGYTLRTWALARSISAAWS